jgi:hypothetical protein
MRWSKIYPNSPLALSHKLIVIQQINEIISTGGDASKDEVILAILILACHDVINFTEEKKKPFNSPLKKTAWLNIYGNLRQSPEHAKAVMELVALRGGIKSLNLPGLAEIIAGQVNLIQIFYP